MTNGNDSLEQNVAIMAACVPPIRPLFHFFDRDHTNPTAYRNRKDYYMHKELDQQPSTFKSRRSNKDQEYGMTSFISSQTNGETLDDDRGGESTLPLGNPTTIRKTTEIDVLR